MWPAALTRLLRRRITYVILALLSIVYIFGIIFDRTRAALSVLHYEEYKAQRTRPLFWKKQLLLLEDHLNRTHGDPELLCRNSVQGRQVLVDERGFVCQRDQILVNGCCNVELPGISYYSCYSCNITSHCCGVYEYCVACCLRPDKRSLLEQVLLASDTQKYIYASVVDHFELCLVKCRTNSHSVEDENKYHNEAAKYCYGTTDAHKSQRKERSGLVKS